MPPDSDSKKRTIRLTTKPASVTTDKRVFSTRAKDAARRAGRTLFDGEAKPVEPAEPSSPPIQATQTTQSRRRPRDEGANQQPQRDSRNAERRGNRRGDQRADRHDNRRGGSTDASAAMSRAVVPPAPARESDGRIRVSKLLSEQGLCSRREADSYIARGWVWADGVRVTELGTRVLPTALLTLDQSAAEMQDSRMTILLNKPIGYVSGQAEDGYQPASVLATIEHQLEGDFTPFRPEHRRGLAPAGRLDIDSTGLLVLTQDGRIAKHLIGENSEVEKEYLVRVEGTLDDDGLRLLNHGLSLEGEALKPAKVRWQNEDQLNFILQEGKKRQIRRMCEMVGLHVVGLKRIRIGRVKLGDLPIGKWRFLGSDESF